jgi:hypothetical protein
VPQPVELHALEAEQGPGVLARQHRVDGAVVPPGHVLLLQARRHPGQGLEVVFGKAEVRRTPGHVPAQPGQGIAGHGQGGKTTRDQEAAAGQGVGHSSTINSNGYADHLERMLDTDTGTMGRGRTVPQGGANPEVGDRTGMGIGWRLIGGSGWRLKKAQSRA